MRISDIPDTGIVWTVHACGQSILVVDRYTTDYPPIPRFNPLAFIEFYRHPGGDPYDRIVQCPRCDDQLDLDTLTESKGSTHV